MEILVLSPGTMEYSAEVLTPARLVETRFDSKPLVAQLTQFELAAEEPSLLCCSCHNC